MAKMKKLEYLFHDTLKDVCFAPQEFHREPAENGEGRATCWIESRFQRNTSARPKAQIDRLEQVFAEIDKKPQSKTCDAIVGIAKEGQEIMDEYKGMPAHDAGLLAAAQAVEHYEMTRYGTLQDLGGRLGYGWRLPAPDSAK